MSTINNNPNIIKRVEALEGRYTDVGLNTETFPISDAVDSDRSDVAASSRAVQAAVTLAREAAGEADSLTLLGSIVAFSGSFGGEGGRHPIPLGGGEPDTRWALCDGTATNGLPVPDLRGRMILGASSAYPAGSTGGTADSSTAVTVGYTTLTVEQMPSHKHGIAIGNDNGAWPYPNGCNGNNGVASEPCQLAGGSQPHTHSLIDVQRNGNLPPYYALAYIIRIA